MPHTKFSRRAEGVDRGLLWDLKGGRLSLNMIEVVYLRCGMTSGREMIV
jgi:hypothetical protein